MKKISALAVCFCMLTLAAVQQLQACDRSSLTLNSVDSLAYNNFEISLTFCVGSGKTGTYTGADAATGTWAVEVFGATITGFPASLTSPATGNEFLGYISSEGWLRYSSVNPNNWWTCISSTASCGDTATICVTFTITTSARPGEIRLLGAEGAGIAFVGCFENADMTVYPKPACSSTTLNSTMNVVAVNCSTKTLDVSVTGGAFPISYSYLWYTPGVPATTQDLTLSYLNYSGYFYGSVTDEAGCADSHGAYLTFSSPTANAGPDKQIYIGYGASCVDVTGYAAGGTPPYSYLWSNGATTATINVCPTVTTTYTLTVTDAAGGCASSDAAIVNVKDVRCGGTKVNVCHSGQTKCVTQAQAATHLSHGDYLGSCGARMAGPASEDFITALAVYPNPVADRAFFSFEVAESGAPVLEVFDLQGQRVMTLPVVWINAGERQSLETDLSGLGAGLYFVRMTSPDGESLVQKLMINL